MIENIPDAKSTSWHWVVFSHHSSAPRILPLVDCLEARSPIHTQAWPLPELSLTGGGAEPSNGLPTGELSSEIRPSPGARGSRECLLTWNSPYNLFFSSLPPSGRFPALLNAWVIALLFRPSISQPSLPQGKGVVTMLPITEVLQTPATTCDVVQIPSQPWANPDPIAHMRIHLHDQSRY